MDSSEPRPRSTTRRACCGACARSPRKFSAASGWATARGPCPSWTSPPAPTATSWGPTLSLRAAPTALGGASLDLSVDVLYHAYEELIMYASREYGTDQDGFRAVVRLGLLIPVPFLTDPDEEASPGGW